MVREAIGLTFVVHEPDNQIEEYRTRYFGPEQRHAIRGKPEVAEFVELSIKGDRLRSLQRQGFLRDYHSVYMYLYDEHLKTGKPK